MSMDADLAAISERHHGVFTYGQARQVGFTPHGIRRRVEIGRWVEVHEGVFRVAGAGMTWRGRLLAACWAGGTRAVVSRRSAAALHGLPGGDRRIVEITCPRWRRARHEGLVVHESKALDAIDVTIVDGIPVTTVARTLFDLGGCSPRHLALRMVEMALEFALRKELVTIAELEQAVRRLSRRGRPGGPVLRQLLEARSDRRRPTESVMETKLLQALRVSGLPEPVPQYEVRVGDAFVARVDLAYPDARIAVEYDSDEFHTGRIATTRDRSRRHALIAAGWLPIDVGPEDVRRGAVTAAAAIADALRRRSGVARSA